MPGEITMREFLLFYAGITFLAMFYWLISFIYTRRSNYLVLAVATVAQTFFTLNSFDVIFHIRRADHLFLAFITLTFCALASELNGFRKNLSFLTFNVFAVFVIAVVIFQALSPIFLTYEAATQISHLLTLLSNVIVLSLFAYLWLKKKQKTACFSFFSYAPAMVGYTFFAFSEFKILPHEFAILSPFGFSIFLLLLFYNMVAYVIAIRKKRQKEHLEKEDLIQQQNILLEKKVEERTRELELERERSEELLIHASQKQMAELELQSLRARLNPHFMFNSLNAIQQLILKKDFERSATYLAKFAKLLRIMLENSEKSVTPLQKEIDFVELYLSLEKLRLPDLQITINTDSSINKGNTFIPNMMLQPYIENALWHGLLHKPGQRKLELKIQKQNGKMICEVTDNGVGRKRSAELKSLYQKEHKSKGMELLAKRFKLLNEEFGSDIKTEVNDVMINDEVGGTTVSITIPDSFTQNIKNELP